jgi:LDH2 family malate/lactate/ureidoglycolate dehydrogenase
VLDPADGVVLDPGPATAAVTAALVADGADREAAATVADHLVDADLSGHSSHGIYRLTEYHQACRTEQVDPRARPTIDRDDGATVTIDGRRAFGQVAMLFAVDAVVERSGLHGVCVATMHSSSHIGRLADAARRLADAGRIGMVVANDSGANQVVAPHGGIEGRLATNPIAFGIPRTQPPHLVLDMATSETSHGTARLAARWSDERDDVGGLLQPLAGHKGFGLALVVEVLAGVLSGAGWSGPDPGLDHQGVCVVAIDPARFRDGFAEAVDELVTWVKSSPGAGVLVPGEPGALAQAGADGIRVDATTWSELLAVFAETGVPPPTPR